MNQIFRYWVELRDLRDDTTRVLPISAFRRILLLPKRKMDAEDAPAEIMLRVQDVGRVCEAPDMKELARQLREIAHAAIQQLTQAQAQGPE